MPPGAVSSGFISRSVVVPRLEKLETMFAADISRNCAALMVISPTPSVAFSTRKLPAAWVMETVGMER